MSPAGARSGEMHHTHSCVDPGGVPADHPSMVPIASWRRLASAGLAAVVLASSLTCMTVACRVVCAAEAGSAVAAAAPTDLPPCHRAGAAGSSTAPVPAGGGCDSGSVCCSTWLHDRTPFQLPAPTLVPEQGAPADGPALVPGWAAAVAAPERLAVRAPADPPDPRPAPALASRPSRAPPAA